MLKIDNISASFTKQNRQLQAILWFGMYEMSSELSRNLTKFDIFIYLHFTSIYYIFECQPLVLYEV